jgi:N-formylglutamate amidohydrolase
LNRPYKGAFETRHFGARLRTRQNPAVGAVQVEFLRESLLGHTAVETLHQPGSDWPAVDNAHINAIAKLLAKAGQALRTTTPA